MSDGVCERAPARSLARSLAVDRTKVRESRVYGPTSKRVLDRLPRPRLPLVVSSTWDSGNSSLGNFRERRKIFRTDRALAWMLSQMMNSFFISFITRVVFITNYCFITIITLDCKAGVKIKNALNAIRTKRVFGELLLIITSIRLKSPLLYDINFRFRANSVCFH